MDIVNYGEEQIKNLEKECSILIETNSKLRKENEKLNLEKENEKLCYLNELEKTEENIKNLRLQLKDLTDFNEELTVKLNIAEKGKMYVIGSHVLSGSETKCPTPGCNGSGNTGKGKSHRT